MSAKQLHPRSVAAHVAPRSLKRGLCEAVPPPENAQQALLWLCRSFGTQCGNGNLLPAQVVRLARKGKRIDEATEFVVAGCRRRAPGSEHAPRCSTRALCRLYRCAEAGIRKASARRHPEHPVCAGKLCRSHFSAGGTTCF